MVVTGAKDIESLKNVKWVYSPLLDAPSKLHLWMTLLRPRLNQFGGLIKKSDVVYIPRLAYPVIPLAKKYGKKVAVHLHDYQPLTYCAAIFPHCEKNYNIDLLSDMKASLQHELLENESIRRASICSLATPLNKLCKLWLSQADEIICVSQKQRSIIESAMPNLSAKLNVVYNPLPQLPMAEKQLGDPTIMYLGGDSYTKGFHIFLQASKKLLKRHQNVKFMLTKRYRDSGKRLIKESVKNYNLVGYLSYEDVLKLHSKSVALLFPSIWEEPLPYVVMEAMLCGTIPIASRVGGIPEIVKGTFAEKMLFEPGNVDECVNRVELLLAMSKEQIENVGFNLRKTVLRRFNQETTKKKLMDIFIHTHPVATV
jgi:glycosyltransferase involved in cell wall biosynthesis